MNFIIYNLYFSYFFSGKLYIIKDLIYNTQLVYLIVKYTHILDEIKIPSLTHCDLWEGNILLSKKDNNYEIAAIIDGDRAIFADSEYEFGCPYMTNGFFIKGYTKELSMDNNSIIRRKIYWICYNLLDCYVLFVQHNNNEEGEKLKDKILKLVSEL